VKNYLFDSYISYLLYAYLYKTIMFSKETSHAYASWVGAENDIYDEIFADNLADQ
jgi:hypothetical protein